MPCYNEAARLKRDEFGKYLRRARDISILFVNDGSRDSTLMVLQQLQSEIPAQIDILHLERNAGKGEAVRAGLLQAIRSPGAPYVGFWDF